MFYHIAHEITNPLDITLTRITLHEITGIQCKCSLDLIGVQHLLLLHLKLVNFTSETSSMDSEYVTFSTTRGSRRNHSTRSTRSGTSIGTVGSYSSTAGLLLSYCITSL